MRSSVALALHPSIVGWRLAWPEIAQLGASIGYRGAVIPRNQDPTANPATGVPVQATAMALPVEVRKDEQTFQDTFALLETQCQFAVRLGCDVASLSIPPSAEQPKAQQASILRERLKRCRGVLEKHSIRMAIECLTLLHLREAHTYEFIWRYEEMLEFALSIDANAGLVMDSWHWHHAGGRADAFQNIPADRILEVHLADSAAVAPQDVRDSERLLPGEGIVDFNLFFEMLQQKSFEREISIEVFGRGLAQMDPTDAARLAFSTTEAMLSNIGVPLLTA